jgi:hypothetical protein
MHISFIPYGKKEFVDMFLRDIAAQKYNWKHWKGKKVKELAVEGQLRILPFGVYEHVFPREYIDQVLTSLSFNTDQHYVSKTKLAILRKMIGHKKAPKFDGSRGFFWVRQHVGIIPIGIREDADMTDPDGMNKGWTHEAI